MFSVIVLIIVNAAIIPNNVANAAATPGNWVPGFLERVIMISSAPARPGHFAELEELEAARKAGTLAAYDLFLARHPESRYAKTAREERAALVKRLGD